MLSPTINLDQKYVSTFHYLQQINFRDFQTGRCEYKSCHTTPHQPPGQETSAISEVSRLSSSDPDPLYRSISSPFHVHSKIDSSGLVKSLSGSDWSSW